MGGMKSVPLTTIFSSVRNRSKNHGELFGRDQTRFFLKSFFEEHRKVSIDAKKHYCSNGCEGNQKGNKNLVLACFSMFASMKQAARQTAGIQLRTCPLHILVETTET